ncbi:hypothetical protein JTE90_028649 [Oedothorax gibbosus]|uniref:Peptidyl-glycine alpha-amidating monooxygenase n=1 Tax=Oedothorax gibbosus TaxID=931172 RepID=A0AAV6V0N7_9ARAC|nr:hypothetical protein JTE90_028649 [Oedothorax gibbosus]
MIGVTVIIFLLVLVARTTSQRMEASPFPADSHFSMNINMPDVKPATADSYLCTAKKLDPQESYIVKYEPDVNVDTAHHMLLFGCKDLQNQNHLYPAHWSCALGDLCSHMSVIYGWAKNAPAMELPPDVGFLVNGNSSIHYLILQIHYANPLPEGVTDNSGLKLHLTTQRQRYVTGIKLLLANMAQIPARTPLYHVDSNCKYEENYPIHPFAYRVHTHKLGTVVTGYYLHSTNRTFNSWTLLAKGNPQWPQAFYPMERKHTITTEDVMAARCTYNSTDMNHPVNIGSSSNDEMCNLYIMYYTEYRNAASGQPLPCIGVQYRDLVDSLPDGNDVPLPKNTEMEQQAVGHNHHTSALTYTGVEQEQNFDPNSDVADLGGKTTGLFNNEYMYQEVHDWPNKALRFGQISAVTLDNKNNVVIFHRADHVWNEQTFDYYDRYNLVDDGPIRAPTVVHLDPITGLLVREWGENLFYMPHGIFIYTDGSFWLTDVALHQVFKFTASNLKKPALTLGEKFVPGHDKGHFCKPTSVAVSKSGEFYVADGYCNSRIVRFSADGKFLSQWGKHDNSFERNPPVGSFRIAHKVVLLEDRDLACVADRENGRIQCFAMVTGRFRFQIQREEFGGTLYSIAYAQEKGLLIGVCGPGIFQDHMVRAFVFNVTDQKLLNVFAPDSGSFSRPHDIAILPSGDEAYVCEIGPNRVWKFLRVYHKTTKKVLKIPDFSIQANAKNDISPVAKSHSSGDKTTDDEEDSGRFQTSVIIMCLLAIPILCLVLVTVVIRLRKRGKFQQSYFGNLKGWWGGYKTPHPQDKFNLGSLLNPHKGFDRVNLEESDADGDENSDSDVEEFSAIARKT